MRLIARWPLGVLVAMVLTTGAPLAFAQDEAPAGPLDADLQNYWAERRDIRVIQHRLYEKVGRHEFTLFGALIPNDPFIDYFPIGLRYDYYLLESLGLELDGSYIGDIFRVESELDTFLSENQVNVDLLDQQEWRAHLGINWSPFYGKLAFLGEKLVHFDINVNAGFGVVGVASPNPEFREQLDRELKPEGALGLGFNFFLNNTFSVSVDYRLFIFQKAGGGVSNPSEISLGFSVFL